MRKVAMMMVLAAAIAGCSSNDNNDNGKTPGETTQPDAGNNTGADVDNSGVEYESSYTYVFDYINFFEQPGSKLNGLLNSNMDLNLDYPVLIMLALDNIDADEGTMYIEGGSGNKTDTPNEYRYNPEADIDGKNGTIDASTGRFDVQFDLFNFVATFPTEDGVIHTVLPIRNLVVSGNIQFNDDGTTEVVNGLLSGHLTKEDGDNTTISIVPGGEPTRLTIFFNQNSLNYDTATGEVVPYGDGDAWFLDGEYTAREATRVD